MRPLALLALLAAAGPPAFGVPGQDARALARAHPRPANLNGEFALEILLELPPGWHVQSERPLDEFLIPTEFVPTPAAGVEWGEVEYPADTLQDLEWAEEPISVYEGMVVLVARGRATGEPPAQLGGVLTYQACTDEVCFPPKTVELQVAMAWEEGAAMAPAATLAPSQDGPPRESVGRGGAGPAGGTPAGPVRSRLPVPPWWGLLAVGIALAFSPCVYPILPVVLLSVTDGRRGWPAAVDAMPLVAGLALSYALVGGISASLGLVGGAVLQNPWFGWGLVGLFTVMGALMLGGWAPEASPRLAALMEALRGRGKVGMGAALGIACAPCTTPVLAGASGLAAATGDPWAGVGMFGLLGVGMGVPLLAVAAAGSHLPRAGNWMLGLKRVLGVALLGYAAFLGWARVDTGAGTVPPPQGATVYYLSARWCVPCLRIKREVWPEGQRVAAARGWDFAFVEIDLTDESPEERAFRDRHGVFGVPSFVVVLSPGGIADYVHEGDFEVADLIKGMSVRAP